MVKELEAKTQLDAVDRSLISKLRETMIKKSKEYHRGFPKFNGDSKQGQAWCANICYHGLDYDVETFSDDDVKFEIYSVNLRTKVLHLEPGTIGFTGFNAAKYLEEILGRFMSARTKGGAKQEFEQTKQGLKKDTLEYYNTKLQLYLHAYKDEERNLQEFKMHTLSGLENL